MDGAATEEHGRLTRGRPRVGLGISALRAGGGERVVSLLGAELPKLGSPAAVFCLEEETDFACQMRTEGVLVRCLGSTGGYDVGGLARLIRELKAFGPDVINVHDRASLPYFVTAAAFLGVPVVYSAHGLLYNADREPRLRYRLSLLGVSGATAVSAEVARRHREVLGWRRPFAVIPNGVPDVRRDDKTRHEIRAELGLRPEEFVFLAMGNARPEKAFEDLLQAAKLLRNRAERPFRCLIAGRMAEDEYCTMLRRRQAELHLDDVVSFLGYRSDSPRLHAAADGFVLCSRSEGLPMVVLEAMMAGLPLVSTRVGGVPEVVEQGRCGLLTQPRCPSELSVAMERLMSDEAARRRYAESGRAQAMKRYSSVAMARQFLAHYRQVLGMCRESVKAGVGR